MNDADPPLHVQGPLSLRGHQPVLDGVRGVAILLVVIYHSNIIPRPKTWAEQLWLGTVNAGWCGVDLFFVLSGFLITGILWDAKGKSGYFRNFWARRILRIFPLYYLFLAVSFFGMPRLVPYLKDVSFILGLDKASPAWFWSYGPNLLFAKEGAFLGPQHLHATWSLGVEEQFYVVWPVVVFLLGRRGLLRLCGAGIVGALLLRLFLFSQQTHWITIFVLPLTRLDTLLAGAFVALWLRKPEKEAAPNPPWHLKSGKLQRWCAVVFVTGLVILTIYSVREGFLAQFHAFTYTIGFTILTAMFTALLLWSVVSPDRARSKRALSLPPLRFLGRYSYGLYLSHPIVQDLIVRHLLIPERLHLELGQSRIAVQLVYTLVSTIASVAFAFLLFHGFERPFLRLKRFFPMPVASVENAGEADSREPSRGDPPRTSPMQDT